MLSVVIDKGDEISTPFDTHVVGVVVVRAAKSQGVRLRGVEETFIRLVHRC